MSEDLLVRVKGMLERAFGADLKGVVLYGSEARGEGGPDSDIDLLALLNRPAIYGEDLTRAIDALYPLQLELLRPIHVTPVRYLDYLAGEFGLYRRARAEGVEA